LYELPQYLESRQTLEVIGLCYKKAVELWEHWCALPFECWPVGPGINLMGFAVEYINGYAVELEIPEGVALEDVSVDWKTLMLEMGISEELIWRTKRGNFRDEQPVIDIKERITDTMEARYEKLQSYQEESFQRALRLHCGCHISSPEFKKGLICGTRHSPR
jgi:hypothetical protein